MLTYKVVEVGKQEQLTLYKGTSKEAAIAAYNRSQSLPFSHKRFYAGAKRLYPYEF